MPTRFGVAAMGSKRPLLINENAEATGAPSGWTTVSGSPNWDYTAVPLADAQSLYLATAAAAARIRVDFTDQTEVFIYFLFRLTNGVAPSAGTPFGGLGANAGAVQQNFSLSTLVKPSFGGAGTVNAFSPDTTYHVWLHYKQGTGANGVVDIGFSTDGIRPTSGNSYLQSTSNAGTNLGGRLFLGVTVTTGGYDSIYDNIRVANTQIGDFGI